MGARKPRKQDSAKSQTQNDRRPRKDRIKSEEMNEKSGESSGMHYLGIANGSNSVGKHLLCFENLDSVRFCDQL